MHSLVVESLYLLVLRTHGQLCMKQVILDSSSLGILADTLVSSIVQCLTVRAESEQVGILVKGCFTYLQTAFVRLVINAKDIDEFGFKCGFYYHKPLTFEK